MVLAGRRRRAGTRKALESRAGRYIARRRAGRSVTEWVRVHPAADMQISTGVFIDREEREVFFVVPELRAELVGELRSILILTAITRQGVLMLWPARA
jgi:hypothetical protein